MLHGTLWLRKSMTKSILIIASHPDDEVLGCGGAILRHIDKGDKVSLLFMTDGVSSRLKTSRKNIRSRIKALKRSSSILGVQSYHHFNFPDNSMDKHPLLNIVKKIETIIKKIQPSVIYTHHHGDLNIDHKITHNAVMTACRPLPDSTVHEIYGFEVLSSTEWATQHKSVFIPNLYIDITKYMNKKIKALEAYNEELRKPPHSRSIEHVKILAKHRGYSMGVEMAEAFEVYRIINR